MDSKENKEMHSDRDEDMDGDTEHVSTSGHCTINDSVADCMMRCMERYMYICKHHTIRVFKSL